jgi:hypothetical protein
MFDWNEDKLNQAKELVKKRISYTKIAKKLGTSKNSVMGKVFRDKVKHGHIPDTNKYYVNTKHKRKEHERKVYFTKHGTAKCWLCNTTYTTYSRFDRFCSPCKTRDYFRNVT